MPPVASHWTWTADKLYWVEAGIRSDTNTGKIQRVNLDGSQVEDVLTGLDDPGGLALDVAAGKLYWTDAGIRSEAGTGKIQRANLDGSQVEDVLTGLLSPGGLALDVGAGKLYWADVGKVQRANLDGSQVEDVVTTGVNRPLDLVLDVGAGKLYWTDWPHGHDPAGKPGRLASGRRGDRPGTIPVASRWTWRRASCTGPMPAGTRSSGANLDRIAGGRRRWPACPCPATWRWTWGRASCTGADRGTGKIQRANLDGSHVEDLVTGLDGPVGLALDVAAGKLYWTHAGFWE